MEKEFNIAAILKDKPKDTSLYSPIFGLCRLYEVNMKWEEFPISVIYKSQIKHLKKDGRFYFEGECMLFPSKEMQDWSKFAWKKGDVLKGTEYGNMLIFKGWNNNDYTLFNAYFHCVDDAIFNDKGEICKTDSYTKATDREAKEYIKRIEHYYGGKLNLETLQIEQPKQEFKDGDIVFMKGIESKLYANCIFILRGKYKEEDEKAFYYAFYNADDKFILCDLNYTRVHYSLRLATDSEKQQLLSKLEEIGKKWNPDTKQIEDLPKKYEFKVFQKVLVRESKTDEWTPNFFFKIHRDGDRYVMACGDMYNYCIPYNDSTKHLLGTTDEWEGGEG